MIVTCKIIRKTNRQENRLYGNLCAKTKMKKKKYLCVKFEREVELLVDYSMT